MVEFGQNSGMVPKITLRSWRICLLGALNGLLVGLVLEQGKTIYLNYEMGRIATLYAQSEWAVDFVVARQEPLIPLVCTIIFAVIAYLVPRYFLDRPRALLLTWLVLGGVALWLGYFMSTATTNAFSFVWIIAIFVVSCWVHRLWKKHVHSVFLLWLVIGNSAFIVLAFGVQLVGLLFYWPELRKSLTWFLCFTIVMVVSALFSFLIHLVFFYDRRKLKHASL